MDRRKEPLSRIQEKWLLPDPAFFKTHIIPTIWALSRQHEEDAFQVLDAALAALEYLLPAISEKDLACFFENSLQPAWNEKPSNKGKFQYLYDMAGKEGTIAYLAAEHHMAQKPESYPVDFEFHFHRIITASLPKELKRLFLETFAILTAWENYAGDFPEKGLAVAEFFMEEGKGHLIPDYLRIMQGACGDENTFSMIFHVPEAALAEMEALNRFSPKVKAQLLQLMDAAAQSESDQLEHFTFRKIRGKSLKARRQISRYDQEKYVPGYRERFIKKGYIEEQIDEIFELPAQYPWLKKRFLGLVKRYARINNVNPGGVAGFLRGIEKICKDQYPEVATSMVDIIFDFISDVHMPSLMAGLEEIAKCSAAFRKNRPSHFNGSPDFTWEKLMMKDFMEQVEKRDERKRGLEDPDQVNYRALAQASCAFLHEKQAQNLSDAMIIHILERRRRVGKLLQKAGVLPNVAQEIDLDEKTHRLQAVENCRNALKVAIAETMVMIDIKAEHWFNQQKRYWRPCREEPLIEISDAQTLTLADYERNLFEFDEEEIIATAGEEGLKNIRQKARIALLYMDFTERTRVAFQDLGITRRGTNRRVPVFFKNTNPDTQKVIALAAMNGNIANRIPEICMGEASRLLREDNDHSKGDLVKSPDTLFEQRLKIISEIVVAERKRSVGLMPVGGKFHGDRGFKREHGAILTSVLGVQHDSFHLNTSEDSLVLPAFATAFELALLGTIIEPLIAFEGDISLQLTGSGR